MFSIYQFCNLSLSFSISPYLPRPLLLKASLSHSLFPIAYSSPHPVIQQTQLMASWWTEPCHFSRSPLGSGLPRVWSTLQIQSIPFLHKQFNTAPLSYRFLTKQLKLERDADWVTNSANTIILTFHFFIMENRSWKLKTMLGFKDFLSNRRNQGLWFISPDIRMSQTNGYLVNIFFSQ